VRKTKGENKNGKNGGKEKKGGNGKKEKKKEKRKKRPLTITEKRNKVIKSINKWTCKNLDCDHEKHHYIRAIQKLKDLSHEEGLLFFTRLHPYQKIHDMEYRGIINGTPSFFIASGFNNNKGCSYGGLVIDLKTKYGRISNIRKKVLRDLLEKKQYLVSVCHSFLEMMKLVNTYLKIDTKTGFNVSNQKELQKLAWAGCTTRDIIASEQILPEQNDDFNDNENVIKKRRAAALRRVLSLNPNLGEEYHHFKVTKFLMDKHYEMGLLFYPSLLPYHDVHQKEMFGIINGIPDFFIAEGFNNGKNCFGGLYIELKKMEGRVSVDQKKLLRRIIKGGHYFVSVCHGHLEAIELIKTYLLLDKKTRLNAASLERLEQLAWEGETKKEWILQ
jgi:hypothetical protein